MIGNTLTADVFLVNKKPKAYETRIRLNPNKNIESENLNILLVTKVSYSISMMMIKRMTEIEYRI